MRFGVFYKEQNRQEVSEVLTVALGFADDIFFIWESLRRCIELCTSAIGSHPIWLTIAGVSYVQRYC